MTIAVHTAAPAEEVSGLVGFALQLMKNLGEVGVGALTFLETVFPPVPSEVILPLAGFLARQGDMNLALALGLSVLGGWLGALVLYALGALVGIERATNWLAKLPLVDRRDFEKATAWFDKHGRKAVFFGRLIPGIRSVISLPAGAARMNLVSFSLLTIAGSTIWNSLLMGAGYALGSQYERISIYADYLNYAVYAALAIIVIVFVVRRIRRGPATRPIRE